MKNPLMHLLYTLLILVCACSELSRGEKMGDSNNSQNSDSTFYHVKYFPEIQDTAQFITDLRSIFQLEVDENSNQKENEKITYYNKVKLYGSEKEYILIEYDYASGCDAAFPWKYQILVTTDGKLIKQMNALRFEFVEVFKSQNMFFLTVNSTSKGNGVHHLYQVTSDTLEDVIHGYSADRTRTYDAHQDNQFFAPAELDLKIKDDNNDGFNDLSFNGNIITSITENSSQENPIEVIFLYDRQTGQFNEKEKYNEKYRLFE
jgi:hypothetical protein